MNWDAVVWIILAVLGGAFIVGGIALYRASNAPVGRTLAGALIGAGVVMWAILLFVIPVSRTTSG